MDALFTPEVITQFLEVLKTAADGSVTVLVVYFLLPALLILITGTAWIIGVTVVVKNIKQCICMRIDKASKLIDVKEKESIRIHELRLAKESSPNQIIHQLNTSDRYLNLDKSALNKLISLLKDGSEYLHDEDFNWFSIALQNQKKLDKHFKKNKYSPFEIHNLTDKEIEGVKGY
jgi:hypothetical protein